MGLPVPDLVLYMDVDLETSLQRMEHRQADTNTKADIHEKDVEYLKNCLHTAQMAAKHWGWTAIASKKNGELRSVEDINQEIYDLILKEIN